MDPPATGGSAMADIKKRKDDAKKKQNGELPPDLDQDGKMINPHNPDFITKVPWYLGSSGPTLKHHSIQKSDHVLSFHETDALINGKIEAQKASIKDKPTVFRKGACKNCGSMTHKEKDCVERPRSSKKAAWKSGLDIAPAEAILNLEDHGKVSYSAKRDQWQGYDPSEYQDTIAKFERIDNERRKLRQEQKELKRREQEDKRRNKALEKELKKTAKKKSDLAAKTKKEKKRSRSKASPEDGGVLVGDADGQPGPSDDEEADSDESSINSANSEDDHDEGDVNGASLTAKRRKNKNNGILSDGLSDDSDSDSDSDMSDYDSDGSSDGGEGTSDFKDRDENARDFQARQARQGGVGGAQMKITVRNLRLREDTPKYLRNLALDSAHYDPKARSMRSNPLPDENPEDLAFAGDNFARHSGDSLHLAQSQVLCWDMQGKGEDIDLITNPSQAELVMKQYKEKKVVLEEKKKNAILEKYGSVAKTASKTDADGVANEGRKVYSATPALDYRLRLGQTEGYTEYSRDGRVIKGAGKISTITKYEEDVYVNNHTSVWGSFYAKSRQQWGYACCHSLYYNSYCTGSQGRVANDASFSHSMDANATMALKLQEKPKPKPASSSLSSNLTKRSELYGEVSSSTSLQLDAEKLSEAKQRHRGVASEQSNMSEDEKKRKYNSMASLDVTKEDMEVYRMSKVKHDDPMAKLMAEGGGADGDYV